MIADVVRDPVFKVQRLLPDRVPTKRRDRIAVRQILCAVRPVLRQPVRLELRQRHGGREYFQDRARDIVGELGPIDRVRKCILEGLENREVFRRCGGWHVHRQQNLPIPVHAERDIPPETHLLQPIRGWGLCQIPSDDRGPRVATREADFALRLDGFERGGVDR